MRQAERYSSSRPTTPLKPLNAALDLGCHKVTPKEYGAAAAAAKVSFPPSCFSGLAESCIPVEFAKWIEEQNVMVLRERVGHRVSTVLHTLLGEEDLVDKSRVKPWNPKASPERAC